MNPFQIAAVQEQEKVKSLWIIEAARLASNGDWSQVRDILAPLQAQDEQVFERFYQVLNHLEGKSVCQ